MQMNPVQVNPVQYGTANGCCPLPPLGVTPAHIELGPQITAVPYSFPPGTPLTLVQQDIMLIRQLVQFIGALLRKLPVVDPQMYTVYRFLDIMVLIEDPRQDFCAESIASYISSIRHPGCVPPDHVFVNTHPSISSTTFELIKLARLVNTTCPNAQFVLNMINIIDDKDPIMIAGTIKAYLKSNK